MGRAIDAIPAFREPAPRLELMDELGLDRAVMWPTLASLVEERLRDDPDAIHAVIHALNEWMHETWTFNYENRIFPTPGDHAADRRGGHQGARLGDRAGRQDRPHPAGARARASGARARSPCPEFDPFWQLVEERDIVVGMHASDSGYQRYINEWEGIKDDEFTPFSGGSGFAAIVGHAGRPIIDTMASAIGHGLCSRFPGLKIVPVENGSGWVRQLLEDMEGRLRLQPPPLRRGPGDGVQAQHLRAPVPRGGPGGPRQAPRRRPRAVRLGLPPPRGHVGPPQLRGRPRGPARRRTSPRSWAAT